MSPQWIPQNIQKRLLLYLLQQISLFSEIDLPNLEEVSLNNVTLKDISIDPEKVGKLPGCNLRYGQVGTLELTASSAGVGVGGLSGGVNLNARDVEIVVSPDFDIDEDIASHVQFSLAQSTADLANTIMLDEQDLEDSEEGSEKEEVSEKPERSNSISSTNKQSTLGGVVQRAVEIALSRISIKVTNINIKIVSELTDLVLEVDELTLITINGLRNVQVSGVRLKVLKPNVNPGESETSNHVPNNTTTTKEEEEEEEKEEYNANENDYGEESLMDSMVFTHEDASTMYMSATSKSFEKSHISTNPEGIDNKPETTNNTPPIVFHMDHFTAEFEGLSQISNLEVIVGNMKLAFTPLTPTIISIFQGITRSLKIKHYQSRRKNKMNSPPKYDDEDNSEEEEEEESPDTLNERVSDEPFFKRLKISDLIISTSSALRDNGEFESPDGINIVFHNINVKQKNELLLYGGIELFKIVRIHERQTFDVFYFESLVKLDASSSNIARPGTPVSISSNTSTSTILPKADIRFEVLMKNDEKLSSLETTFLCSKTGYFQFDLQSLLILSNFTLALTTIHDEFKILKTTIDNINSQSREKPRDLKPPVVSKDQFILQTSSIFITTTIDEELKLQLIIFPIKYNLLQDKLTISKILLNSICQDNFKEAIVTLNEITLITKLHEFKAYLHPSSSLSTSNALPRSASMSSNLTLLIHKITSKIPLKDLKFIIERLSGFITKFGELSSLQSNSLQNSVLDERSSFVKLDNSVMMGASMYGKRGISKRIGPGIGGGAPSYLHTNRFNLAKFCITIKEVDVTLVSVLPKFGDLNVKLVDISLYQLKQNLLGFIVYLKVVRQNDKGQQENFVYQYQDKPVEKFEFPMILLRCKKSGDKSSTIEINIRNILVEYYTKWLTLLNDDESIIDTVEEEIIEKVTPNTKSSGSNRFDIRYTLYDSVIGLSPGRLKSKAYIFVEKGNSDFTVGVNQFYIKCSFRNISAVLIDDVKNETKNEALKDKSLKFPASYVSPMDYYLSLGYIQIGKVNVTHVGITFNTDIEEIKSRNERLGIYQNLSLVDVKINSDEHQVDLCADSTNVVLQLINDLKLPLDFTDKDRIKVKLDNKVNLMDGVDKSYFSDFANAMAELNIDDEKSEVDSQGTSSLVFEEEHFDKNRVSASSSADSTVNPVKVNINLSKTRIFLYDGYDWKDTRKVIRASLKHFETQVKDGGNKERKSKSPSKSSASPPAIKFDVKETISEDEEEGLYEETLFQSIHVAFPRQAKPSDVADAINNTITPQDENTFEEQKKAQANISGKNYKNLKLRRSLNHKVYVDLKNIEVNVDVFSTRDPRIDKTDPNMTHEMLSSVEVRLGTVDIYDNVPTSTWNKFLSYMNSLGEREIGTSMVRISILNIRPAPSMVFGEMMMNISVLPLRLHVDQDTLDFLVRFLEFKDKRFDLPVDEIPYIQRFIINPLKIKLDYKPKKVDYVGLRSGKHAELANFFILDGSSITLPQVKLYGILGMPKLGLGLAKAWQPVFQSSQVIGIISGWSPLRSVVNIGGGFKDLVAVPLAEYKKDGRLWRSIQKGTQSFAKTTGYELLNLGVKLASGTQVLLEQGEEMLGGEGNSARAPRRRKSSVSDDDAFIDYDHVDEFKSESGNLLLSSEILSNRANRANKDHQLDGRKLYSYLDLDEEDEEHGIDQKLLSKSIFLLAPSGNSKKKKSKSKKKHVDDLISEYDELNDEEDDTEEADEYDVYAYDDDDLEEKLVSLYSNQPESIQQGLELAYKSIGRNLKVTKNQLITLKNELNESESFQESVVTVLRNSPIILIRPMIGTTEALSKALMGISNKVDSKHIIENKDKYRSGDGRGD
ncbi:Autophagy-related protein 2 [Spathaspora sp. JA1]|nr:Autophagy-related protein 2 [Spathaspora sp. JA1]